MKLPQEPLSSLKLTFQQGHRSTSGTDISWQFYLIFKEETQAKLLTERDDLLNIRIHADLLLCRDSSSFSSWKKARFACDHLKYIEQYWNNSDIGDFRYLTRWENLSTPRCTLRNCFAYLQFQIAIFLSVIIHLLHRNPDPLYYNRERYWKTSIIYLPLFLYLCHKYRYFMK